MESELIWTWSRYVPAYRGSRFGGGDPSEAAHLEDFELDREATDAEAVEWFDALPESEQERIETEAHEKELVTNRR